MRMGSFLICLLLFMQQIYAETLTIYNHARYQVYAAIYYVQVNIWQTSIGPAARQGAFIEIPARSSGTLERPGFVPLVNREIIFSTKSADLTPTLGVDAYKKAAAHPAGWTHGATYHIAEQEKTLHCYSEVEWRVTKPIIDAADAVVDKMLSELQETYSKYSSYPNNRSTYDAPMIYVKKN